MSQRYPSKMQLIRYMFLISFDPEEMALLMQAMSLEGFEFDEDDCMNINQEETYLFEEDTQI